MAHRIGHILLVCNILLALLGWRTSGTKGSMVLPTSLFVASTICLVVGSIMVQRGMRLTGLEGRDEKRDSTRT